MRPRTPRIHEPEIIAFLQTHRAATLRQLAALMGSKSSYAYKPIQTMVAEKTIRVSRLDPDLGNASQGVAQLTQDARMGHWTLEQLQLADVALQAAQGPLPWDWLPGSPPAIQQGAIVLPVFSALETDRPDGSSAIARIHAYVENTGARELCYADWEYERDRAVARAFRGGRITLHAGWTSFRNRPDPRYLRDHNELLEEAYQRLDALRAGDPV